MLELSDPPDCVVRHHGEGSIRVMVWGSLNANPQFLVRLYGSGKVLVVDQSDLRMAGNPGDERDEGGLQIPEDWKPQPKASQLAVGQMAISAERYAELRRGQQEYNGFERGAL